MLGERCYVSHEWLKPKAVEERLYQTRILETARRKSTLVVLPTALGKTVIALLLALERIELGKVFFLAPTRPLVQQHHRMFMEKTLLDEDELVMVTGRIPPEKRVMLYRIGKIIFATPQCILNDLKRSRLGLEDVSLIIFDEAHRARGNYAYVGIASAYQMQGRNRLVLGLTASPGSREDRIADVCSNLGIEAIEYRTDEDVDVKPYIQPIEVEWRKVKLPQAYVEVRDTLREMIVERVKGLQSLGVLSDRQPAFITRRDLVELNEELQRRLGSGEGGYLYNLKVQATAALSIMHMIELIETQGAETLQAFIRHSLRRMALEGSRGHKSILNDPLFIQARRKLEQCLKTENPKMAELIRVLKRQITAKPSSRMIVFTQYRDTVKAILQHLKGQQSIRAARFVGQGEREGDSGMSQEKQRETLERLREGEINVLVATSIAEEGLDIPEVDHVVFYEPVPSEIRYIQRRGRTGRRVAGKVTILIAESTLDEAFYWASVKGAERMKRMIRRLNKKLPQMLKERREKAASTIEKPVLKKPLTSFVPEELVKRGKAEKEKTRRFEMWAPSVVRTKGLSHALKWLMENLPEAPTPVEVLVERAVEEEGLDTTAVETAIWRLIQQGRLYQPKPSIVQKL